MATVSELADRLGDSTKDLRLNISNVLKTSSLDEPQRYTVALSSAYFIHAKELAEAIQTEAASHLSEEAIEDAKAAAAIMAMNTVFYRFRHMVQKETYQQRPAGLRMNRMMRPATSKALFELCSLACAALAGCEMCIRSHEESVLKHGLGEEHVHDTIRIASVVNGFWTAYQLS